MLIRLSSVDFGKTRPLFQGEYLTLIIDGVLAGNGTSLLWADDAAQPQTALMWDNGYILYLVGEAANCSFNQQLGELYMTQIAPAARKQGIDGFKILYSSASWASQLDTVFPGLSLAQHPRVVYSLRSGTPPAWRNQLPSGYAMRPIDRELLAADTLGNAADLVAEIEACWPSQERFLAQGFGFCLVGHGEIVCRCTAEYVSPGKCGIGIATAEAYRRQGFATLTASAFIEESLAQGKRPYWDAWLRNTASVATAEKIGLQKIQDHNVHVGALV